MAEIDTLRELLGSVPDIAVAILFGSAARDSLTATSDIDLGLAFANGVVTPERKRQLLEMIGQSLGRPADIVDLRVRRGRLPARIMRQGVPLVVRDTSLWARLLREAVMWEEDMAPNWRLVQRGQVGQLADGR